MSHISPLQSYFSQNEITYATHCVGHYFNKLPDIIDFSRKEISDFPVPLPEGLSLYPYQRAGVEFLVKKRNALLADSMGLGKAEYVGNRVWTPYGRVQIGKLRVGDKIFTYTGELTTVTGVYPQGKQPLYRVSLSDGYFVLTTAEHLWAVLDSENRQLVLPLEKIIQMNYKNLKIPLANPLKYPKNSLPFPPYTFGMIVSHEISRSKNNGVYIPDVYRYSSLDDKVSLLQGIVDCIGCVDGDSDICIKVNGSRIADDIVELVHSLGGLAIRQKNHELIIKLPANIIPFRSIHKLENYIPKNDLARYITSIEFEKVDEAVCISVDHLSRLYLTEHAIVTHNTVQFIGYLNYTI